MMFVRRKKRMVMMAVKWIRIRCLCVCVYLLIFLCVFKKKGTLVCYKDIGRGGVRVGYIDYYTLYIRIYIYIYMT